MNDRSTPETDAKWHAGHFISETMACDFARKLERELDETRALLTQYSAEREHNAMQALAYKTERDETLKQLEAMRKAIREAHNALRMIHDVVNEHVGNPVVIIPLGYANTALAKLQPFIKS